MEVGWAYTESTHDHHVVRKSSEPDLLVLVDLAAGSRSLRNKLSIFNSSYIREV